jgi:hypothetical protein
MWLVDGLENNTRVGGCRWARRPIKVIGHPSHIIVARKLENLLSGSTAMSTSYSRIHLLVPHYIQSDCRPSLGVAHVTA